MAFPNFGFSDGRRWRRRRSLSNSLSEDHFDDTEMNEEELLEEDSNQVIAGLSEEHDDLKDEYDDSLLEHDAADMADLTPNVSVEPGLNAPGGLWENVAVGMSPQLDFESLLKPGKSTESQKPSSSVAHAVNGSVSDGEISADPIRMAEAEMVAGETTTNANHSDMSNQDAASDEWHFDQSEWQTYLPQNDDDPGDDDDDFSDLEPNSSDQSTFNTENSVIEHSETEEPRSEESADSVAPDGLTNVAMESGTAERSRFFTDEEHIIEGDADASESLVYPALPEGLLESATRCDDDDRNPESASSSWTEQSEAKSSETFDTTESIPGAVMKDTTDMNGSKHELTAASRMERLNPKSANSLTGAPAPKVDGRVEDSVLAPETEVLLVVLHAPERNTFRTYLRRHDIPCRAAISAENAVSIVLEMKPAVVLISGSGMNPEEILTLVDDLNDMVDAPILTLLTESQIKLLSNDPLNSHVLQYPASLRHIRSELSRILVEEGNAKPRCSLRSALMPE
ncbi:MAG: hypothetical protein R3C59_28160 [Planctomycetaceae bacterium]